MLLFLCIPKKILVYSSTLDIRHFKSCTCTICMGDFSTFTKVRYICKLSLLFLKHDFWVSFPAMPKCDIQIVKSCNFLLKVQSVTNSIIIKYCSAVEMSWIIYLDHQM